MQPQLTLLKTKCLWEKWQELNFQKLLKRELLYQQTAFYRGLYQYLFLQGRLAQWFNKSLYIKMLQGRSSIMLYREFRIWVLKKHLILYKILEMIKISVDIIYRTLFMLGVISNGKIYTSNNNHNLLFRIQEEFGEIKT